MKLNKRYGFCNSRPVQILLIFISYTILHSNLVIYIAWINFKHKTLSLWRKKVAPNITQNFWSSIWLRFFFIMPALKHNSNLCSTMTTSSLWTSFFNVLSNTFFFKINQNCSMCDIFLIFIFFSKCKPKFFTSVPLKFKEVRWSTN